MLDLLAHKDIRQRGALNSVLKSVTVPLSEWHRDEYVWFLMGIVTDRS